MSLGVKIFLTIFALALFIVPTPVTDIAAIAILSYTWAFAGKSS